MYSKQKYFVKSNTQICDFSLWLNEEEQFFIQENICEKKNESNFIKKICHKVYKKRSNKEKYNLTYKSKIYIIFYDKKFKKYPPKDSCSVLNSKTVLKLPDKYK